jgi:uncharacterized membrane protein
MCLFFTSESIYPKKFLLLWGFWSLIDALFVVLGAIYANEVVCKVDEFGFDLALFLRALGLIGLIVNMLTCTFEVNPSYVPRQKAIIFRSLLIIPCFIWFIVGIIYLAMLPSHCSNVEHTGIVIFALISMFCKCICLPFSTNYSLINRQYTNSLL